LPLQSPIFCARTGCIITQFSCVSWDSQGHSYLHRISAQFVSVGSATPVSEQFLWLGVLFLLLEWAAIAIYAGLGAYLQRWFNQPGPRRVFNRVSASLLGCAGLGLLAARR
jgi:threonine/homoserine/homoserine lactone efflux protein